MAFHPGTLKRQKEAARRERAQEKAQRKAERQKEKEERKKNSVPGEDPDIAGIVPGPQPPLEE